MNKNTVIAVGLLLTAAIIGVVIYTRMTSGAAARAAAAAAAKGKTPATPKPSPTVTVRASGTKNKSIPPPTAAQAQPDAPPADNTVDINIGDIIYAAEEVPVYNTNVMPDGDDMTANETSDAFAYYVNNGDKIGVAGNFDGTFQEVFVDGFFGASTYYIYTDSLVAI